MTLFDLLAIFLFLFGSGALAMALIQTLLGRGKKARTLLMRLAFCATAYVTAVYLVTAISRPVIRKIGDAQCSDDWCLAVEGVKRVPKDSVTVYDVTLRIFSRARRVAQREMGAKDVYLVDAQWRRYDPAPRVAEIPLNVLLHAGESVVTRRTFEVPAGKGAIGLQIDRGRMWICLVIGECGAFHKGAVLGLD